MPEVATYSIFSQGYANNESTLCTPTGPAMYINLRVPSHNLPRRVFYFFLTIEVSLLLFDYVFNMRDLTGLAPVRHFANLAKESGVGTWFATMQLFLVSIAAFSIATKSSARVSRCAWVFTSLFFLFMSVDEAAMIHERVGSIGREISAVVRKVEGYHWHVVIGPFFVIAGVTLLAFLWRELPVMKLRLLVLLAFCTLAIATGLDYLEGLRWSNDLADQLAIDPYDLDHLLRMCEEILEMFGHTLFLTVFLSRLCSLERQH